MHAPNGGFHVKAGFLEVDRSYFAAKINANFPANRSRFGLPTIQGVIVLADAENGYPLALMDSIEITIQRTGAATAVAAKSLARPDSRVATICGCGIQGRIQLEALTRVRPVERAHAYDTDPAQAERFAAAASRSLGIEVTAARDLASSVKTSDICVTCTPSREALFSAEDVSPGTFVAAVGADSPEKQELDPALLVSNTVVVDILEQCAAMGDLHHALSRGWMSETDVHAELGEVVAGRKPGRTRRDEITIFDSTGMALQDVAAAIVVHEKARKLGRGRTWNLAD
jgi:ornithine cyclodeaminase/alanine dehydrogenase-like protein (mu-crystallin family)